MRRTATCTWRGDLEDGRGEVGAESGTFTGLELSWRPRIGEPDGHSSPEELLAGAHASCFAMTLSRLLSEDGYVPQELIVRATVNIAGDGGMPTITGSDLFATGVVPGLDAGAFLRAATDAGRTCPVSRALAPITIRVSASLHDAV